MTHGEEAGQDGQSTGALLAFRILPAVCDGSGPDETESASKETQWGLYMQSDGPEMVVAAVGLLPVTVLKMVQMPGGGGGGGFGPCSQTDC